jgi:hypothetical protein
MDAPYDQASTEITRVDSPLIGEQNAPTIIAGPGGDRAVIDKMFDQGLYELSSQGSVQLLPAGEDGSLLDADFGNGGEAWAMARLTDFTIRLYSGGTSPSGTSWFEAGGTTDSTCADRGAAVVVENGGNPVGFCGGEILTLGTGSDLVVDTAGNFGFAFAADGARSSTGEAEFFFLAAGNGGTELHQMVRNPLGGWIQQTLLQVPGAAYQGSHLIKAADATRVAIVDLSCGAGSSCPGHLYEARDGGGGAWTVEDAGMLGDSHDASESLAAGGDTIATGSITIVLHTRDASGNWTASTLGHVGQSLNDQTTPSACDVTGDAPEAVRLGLVLALGIGALLMLRRGS